MTEQELESSIKSRSNHTDLTGAAFELGPTIKTPMNPEVEALENPQDWFIANLEIVREQYEELSDLTSRLLDVKQDLEDFLQRHDEFDFLGDSDALSSELGDQEPDPFAEGGSNNPLEIRDDDNYFEVEDLSKFDDAASVEGSSVKSFTESRHSAL